MNVDINDTKELMDKFKELYLLQKSAKEKEILLTIYATIFKEDLNK